MDSSNKNPIASKRLSDKLLNLEALIHERMIDQVVVTCEPTSRLQANRNALHTVVETLESHKISIPYTQLDLHAK